MALYKEDIIDIELESGSIHRSYLIRTIGSGDALANRFGVRLFRNGEPVSAEGAAVTAVFMAPSGTNYAISETSYPGSTGTSGNVAYVQLPPVCYAVNGQFTLAIKLSSGSVEGTMRIVDGTVSDTGESGAVVPTSTIPATEDIIAAYEEAVAVVAGSVRFDITQSLSGSEKGKARTNIDAAGIAQVVRVDAAQSMTDTQKGTARTNVGAAADEDLTNGLADQKTLADFEAAAQNAKRENGSVSISLSGVPMYRRGYYMETDGTETEVEAHSIHVIEDAEGICQIRFVQLATSSSPLFVVKDADGDVVRTYKPTNSNLTNLEYSCMIFPGGLPAGCTVYINYFYENSNHAKVVTDIDIHYEPKLKNKAHGKDLFDSAKALELSGTYYSYEDGKQQKHTNYCAGEARVSAGDVFITSKICHVAFYNEYGVFISGELNTTGWYTKHTAPSGTAGAYISYKISEVEDAEVLIDQIHFTVPVNQKILETGQSSSTYVDDEDSVVDVNAVMKLPKTYSENGEPIPLVIVFHGAGFYVSASNWGISSDGTEGNSEDFDEMMRYFVYCGYAVCDINGYDNTIPRRTWGSQRTILAYKKLHEYVKDHYNVEQVPNGFGFSMGGLVALNYINEFHDLKCLALASPVVALYDQVYSGTAVWKAALADSYGFDVPSGFTFSDGAPTAAEQELWNESTDMTNGYDPFVRANTDKANTLYPFMRIWHGDSDTAVSYLKSQTYSGKVRERLTDCTYRIVTGGGHEICYGHNGMCNREYVRFLNRFNFIIADITPR